MKRSARDPFIFSSLTCFIFVAMTTGVTASACPPPLSSQVSCQCFSDRVSCIIEFTSLYKLSQQIAVSGVAVSLLELHVSGTSRLPERFLENVTLVGLTVTESGISLVEDASFASLSSSLEALGLVANKLTAVPSAALSPLRRLQRLDLSRNRIRVLEPGAFEALSELEFLDLSYNELSVIFDDAFKGLDHLEHLDLSSCRLQTPVSLPTTTLPRLAWLSLSKCQWKGTLDHWGFPDPLLHLDLSHNAVTDIPPGQLRTLAQLQTLDLSWNFLSNVSLDELPRLRTLDLSHNTLEAVPTVSGLASLVVLRLDSNFVEEIADDFLADSPMLQEIDLSDNNVRHVPLDWVKHLENVHTLLLEDNLLRCDCSLAPLVTWLSESGGRLTDESRASFVCEEPLYVQGSALSDLDADDLDCDDGDSRNADTAAPLERYLDQMQRIGGELRRRAYERGRFWLSWRLLNPPLPYKCDSLFVWEENDPRPENFRHFPAQCHSRRLADPTLLSVDFPAFDMKARDYHACLVLFARHHPLLVCATGLRRDLFNDPCPSDVVAEWTDTGAVLVSWHSQQTPTVRVDCSVRVTVRLGKRVAHNASAPCSAQVYRAHGLDVGEEAYEACVAIQDSSGCGETCTLLATVDDDAGSTTSDHRSVVAMAAGVAAGLVLLLSLALALSLFARRRHPKYLLRTNEEGPRYKVLLESHRNVSTTANSTA